MHDVAIAGGGPAGLAAAIRAARRGLRTVVFERKSAPVDKGCGEGLMPAGVRALRDLGVSVEGAEFRGIRYLQEDGTELVGHFRDGAGLGVRRTVLSAALAQEAARSGAELRRGHVLSAVQRAGAVELETEQGPVAARLLLAADGLHSPLRRAAGLSRPAPAGAARFGARAHFCLPPWSDLVEVHWASGAEAYVTPVGPRSVNVAFLWSLPAQGASAGAGRPGFDELLCRFPVLQRRLAGAARASEARGAGPFQQEVRSRVRGRIALLGDAAGYLDAITGQGLSLAFAASALLFSSAPADLAADVSGWLRRWDAEVARRFRRYALPCAALLALSRRPRARRLALRLAARVPGLFSLLLGVAG